MAGAGQSNLSTGVAALIQDQLINSHQVRSYSPDQDFIEMDFDPGSESDGDSDDSDNRSGLKRGRYQIFQRTPNATFDCH